jgi:hypothetical protein
MQFFSQGTHYQRETKTASGTEWRILCTERFAPLKEISKNVVYFYASRSHGETYENTIFQTEQAFILYFDHLTPPVICECYITSNYGSGRYFNKIFQHFWWRTEEITKTSARLRDDIGIHYLLNQAEDFKQLNSSIRHRPAYGNNTSVENRIYLVLSKFSQFPLLHFPKFIPVWVSVSRVEEGYKAKKSVNWLEKCTL